MRVILWIVLIICWSLLVLTIGDWFVEPGDVSVYTRMALEPLVRGLMDGAVGFRCVMGA